MSKIELVRPTLILGCGISSSGKTTVLTEIAGRVYDTFWVSKDTVNDSFLGTHSGDDTGIFAHRFSGPVIPRNDDFYHENVKLQSYHCMLELARDNLSVGKHPMLEGNYTKEVMAGYLEAIVFPYFEDIDYALKIVWCHADEEVIWQRLMGEDRARDADKTTKEGFEKLLKQQPILPKELEKYDHVKACTNPGELVKTVKDVIDYLVQ